MPYRTRRRGLEGDDLYGASQGVQMLLAGRRLAAQPAHVLAAQRAAGNRAVAQLLGADEVVSGCERQALAIRTSIPCGTSPSPGPHRPPALSARDGASAGGGTYEIDYPEPGEAMMSIRDAIAPALTFQTATSQGNSKLAADEFGLTSWSSKVVDPVVTPDPANNAFSVTATIDCPIRWEVHSRGKLDVPSEMAPIKPSKWPTAASDLTPDMSDDNGRPPRTEFWAKDLTERHEKFHANDFTKYGKAAFDLATKWLQTKTAATADDALKLTKKVPEQMTATLVAALIPKAERRAYGDGAPSYKARAEAITKRGKAGEYAP